MNVVDSSGWVEYLIEAVNADFFAPPILDSSRLIVPSISVYEVFKILLRTYNEDTALYLVRTMYRGQIVPLNAELGIAAARLSLQLRLPMADSIILATAQAYDATLWTQDVDFEDIEGVRYVRK